jgi:hypothetical protein
VRWRQSCDGGQFLAAGLISILLGMTTGSDAGRCSLCGRPLDAHNREIRAKLPDPVLAVPASERADRTWGNDVLMQVQGIGAFVRVLLPIRLSGGYSIRVAVWLGVHPTDLRHAYEVWWAPEYVDLRLEGRLATAVPPWGDEVFGKPASAIVRDPDQLPYLSSTTDSMLTRVLAEEWPHEEILAALDPNALE